ncbi:MAG: NRDE family protein [Flavobacterium sp.]
MCTVSFVNSNGKYIITSNRDEKVARPKAIEPKNYLINDKKVFYPKDSKAGGTWYAVDEKAHILVLLNGAKEKHVHRLDYRKSRGLIALDLIGQESIITAWSTIDLENIEPFTLVVFENQNLYQLQWNEIEKETVLLDKSNNYIWSSSTLYAEDVREKRKQWFYEFIASKEVVTNLDMFDFHRHTDKDNLENGLIINRNNILMTLSITQTVIEQNKVLLTHLDLIKEEEFTNSFIVI